MGGDGRIAEKTFLEKKKPDLTDDACSDALLSKIE
jgi:hypothetical protein